MTQAVSDYGVGRYALEMNLAFFAFGIGIIALALALSSLGSSSALGQLGTTAFLVAGLCLFAVGFFPTDLEGAPNTAVGTAHSLLSVVAFLAIILGTLVLSRRFRRTDSLRPFYKSSMALAILIVVLLVILSFVQTVGYLGIGERVFIFSFYSWMLLTSVRIFRLPP